MLNRRNLILKLMSFVGVTSACESLPRQSAPIIPSQPSKPNLPIDVDLEPISRALRFAVCSDGHYGQSGTNFIENHRQLVGWLNKEKEETGLDFVVFNGDMVHDKLEHLAPLKDELRKLSVPFYVTRGNHDMFSNKVWKESWGYEPNHAFETDLYGFILGDTSDETGSSVAVDKLWLKSMLESYKSKAKIFVFLHIPQGVWSDSGVKGSEAMTLIESYENVCAIFHGHQHEKDGVHLSGGKPYLFDGHFGGNWGAPYSGYRVVVINDNGEAKTFQKDGGRGAIVNESMLV